MPIDPDQRALLAACGLTPDHHSDSQTPVEAYDAYAEATAERRGIDNVWHLIRAELADAADTITRFADHFRHWEIEYRDGIDRKIYNAHIRVSARQLDRLRHYAEHLRTLATGDRSLAGSRVRDGERG